MAQQDIFELLTQKVKQMQQNLSANECYILITGTHALDIVRVDFIQNETIQKSYTVKTFLDLRTPAPQSQKLLSSPERRKALKSLVEETSRKQSVLEKQMRFLNQFKS